MVGHTVKLVANRSRINGDTTVFPDVGVLAVLLLERVQAVAHVGDLVGLGTALRDRQASML